MDQNQPVRGAPPPEWIDAVARGETDLAAGRTVPAEALLAALNEANDRMMARHREASDAPLPMVRLSAAAADDI